MTYASTATITTMTITRMIHAVVLNAGSLQLGGLRACCRMHAVDTYTSAFLWVPAAAQSKTHATTYGTPHR
jgi:hypothetical protein